MPCTSNTKPFENGNFWVCFEDNPSACAVIDVNGKFCAINRKFNNLFQYSCTELEQYTLEDLIHPSDREASKASFRQVIEGKNQIDIFKKRMQTKDGLYINVLTNTLPLKSQDGEIVAVAMSCVEIPIYNNMKDVKKVYENLEQCKKEQAQQAVQTFSFGDKVAQAFYIDHITKVSLWDWDRILKATFISVIFIGILFAIKYLFIG